MTTWDNVTDELKKICEINWISINLVFDLLDVEKTNLWSRWTSHKSMIESVIREHTNQS